MSGINNNNMMNTDVKSVKNRRPITCGLCGQAGHNKRTCLLNTMRQLRKRKRASLTNSTHQMVTKPKPNHIPDRLNEIKRVYTTLSEDTYKVTSLYDYNVYYLKKLIPWSDLPMEIILRIFKNSHPEYIQDRYKKIHFKHDNKSISIKEANRYFIFEIALDYDGLSDYVYIPFDPNITVNNIRVDWGDGTQDEGKHKHLYEQRRLTISEIRNIIELEHADKDEKERERMLYDREYIERLHKRRNYKFIITVEFLNIPDDYKVVWYNDYSFPVGIPDWVPGNAVSHIKCITHINMWGKHVSLPDGGEQFRGLDNLVWMTHLLFPNTSHIKDMAFMFADATLYNQPLPEHFDTSNVTNMSYMFANATSYNQPLPERFDISKVDNMESMFHDAESYDQPWPEGLDTSHVMYTDDMFWGTELWLTSDD